MKMQATFWKNIKKTFPIKIHSVSHMLSEGEKSANIFKEFYNSVVYKLFINHWLEISTKYILPLSRKFCGETN